jgi:hypothetical protein
MAMLSLILPVFNEHSAKRVISKTEVNETESMLYSWRSKRRQAGQPFEGQKKLQQVLNWRVLNEKMLVLWKK